MGLCCASAEDEGSIKLVGLLKRKNSDKKHLVEIMTFINLHIDEI